MKPTASARAASASQPRVDVAGRALGSGLKTMADFRAENTVAIKNVCREFIVLCRRWKLLTETTVAIDGSKFKAVNHRDRNFTSGKMKTRMMSATTCRRPSTLSVISSSRTR